MTESSFPFDAPAEQPESSDRRKMALLAGAGALAVAVLGYFVVVPAFAGDGSDAAPVTAVRKPGKTQAKGKAPAKPAAKAPAKPVPVQPDSYADVRGREHPFRPLWTEPVKNAGGAAPAGTGTVPAAPGTVTGPAAPSTTGSGSGSGSAASVGGQRVALMTVYDKDGVQYAQAKVGDVVYSPRVGQVFAVSYKLLATSGKTATFLYGDEQFTLSVGQEVLK